jgi:hypothetical protein
MENRIKLSREEKLREETRLAKERGIPIIPGPNVAMQELIQAPLLALDLVGEVEVTLDNQGNQEGKWVNGSKPFLAPYSPPILMDMIRFRLQQLNDGNRAVLVPEILKLFSQLASQHREYNEPVAMLYKEVLTKLFAEDDERGGEAAN